ncbi:hypothetical protein [Azospirillum halopraeferens]|uniref:hypothetical protein n=1 Tax=Azospirillum halopraeferens TaxID=34010 RepID=UPI0012EB2F5E|nr:hypothetical protein [Azospirillum halopraeferens]
MTVRRRSAAVCLALVLAAAPAGGANAQSLFNWNGETPPVSHGNNGSPIPTMTREEYTSFLCMAGGALAGTMTVLAGGAAIIATGANATTTETAVAVPVLVATIAAGCGLGTAMAPALAWLHNRGDALVREIEALK